MDEYELRIILLGKTGVGKSSVGNAILGKTVFKESSLRLGINFCQKEETMINGRRIVVIDTPGIFDTDLTEEEHKQEIISCMLECEPGPHVFILVLKVDRYITKNQQTVEKLLEYFSGDVINHMVLLFTHGDNLKQNMTIQDFIDQSDDGKKMGRNQSLKGLVERCGNRVHVIDKHWNKNSRDSTKQMQTIRGMMLTPADETPWFNVLLSDDADPVATDDGYESVEQNQREYRTNKYQLTQLMKSVKNILKENKGQHYKNINLNIQRIGEALNEEIRNRRQGERENREARGGLLVFLIGLLQAGWRRLIHQKIM